MYESIFSHYFSIDIDTDEVVHNDDEEFLRNVEKFVEDKMSDLYFSDSNREYTIKERSTQVLSNIKYMIDTDDEDERIEQCEVIAKRLLNKEKDVQSRITHLDQDVQKGGLIITNFKKNATEYYAIVKIHYIDFYEENTFKEQRGLPKKHVILKTAICKINSKNIDNYFFLSDSTKPKGHNAAKFWWDDFLELTPTINDTDNTKIVFTKVDGLLKNEFKNDKDSYWYFRNNLVSYLRSEDQFIFNSMIERTLGTLDIESLNNKNETEKATYKSEFESRIKALQVKDGKRVFDTEFTIDKKEVTARIKRRINLMNNVDLEIKGEIDDFKRKILADQDADGKYIKIYSDTGYSTFKSN
ncbi:MAG: nucleoid-associated protein [Candidatus Cloacimonetes bacterium]|nr:nucleoid-associated protein [Candidatus Cloacimonadota bacterium]